VANAVPITRSEAQETGGTETDIRHGEWAFFEIGRIVSDKPIGLMHGDVTFDEEKRSTYSHNIGIGHLSYEIYAPSDKRLYGLHYDSKHPNVWSTLLVISADDATAMQVQVKIDMTKSKEPVTHELTV
jgi:hypothetical protein